MYLYCYINQHKYNTTVTQLQCLSTLLRYTSVKYTEVLTAKLAKLA